jgi:ribonucleoside-diphosphate reductase alpha chain
MSRDRLPDRRESELIEVEHVWRGAHGEVVETMLVTISRHEDGRIGEVFIDYPPRDGERKKSERTIALGRDIAVLISIALQYGAPLDVLCHAVSREDAYVLGEIRVVPSTPVGTVLDAMAAERQP